MNTKISLKDRSILIVGGAGFVGSNLSRLILDKYEPKKICIVDNLLSSDISNVPIDDRVQFLFGSIADDKILRMLSEDTEIVFHLACYHGNQSSIADPIADHDNNTITTLKLFERLKEFSKLKKVVYAAAGCAVAEKTFGSATATTEEAPVSLFHDSPYSISKLIGEMYGNFYFMRYNLPFVKARFQNVYGPREILGAGRWRGTVHTVWRNVIPTFIWHALHGESLHLDNGGDASRDFIYVDDMVLGLVKCAEKGQPGQTYNLASGKETTIFKLAQLINDFTSNGASVVISPRRDWDRSGKRFGDISKSKQILGFSADVSIENGLLQTIRWTKDSQKIIQQSIDNHKIFMK